MNFSPPEMKSCVRPWGRLPSLVKDSPVPPIANRIAGPCMNLWGVPLPQHGYSLHRNAEVHGSGGGVPSDATRSQDQYETIHRALTILRTIRGDKPSSRCG